LVLPVVDCRKLRISRPISKLTKKLKISENYSSNGALYIKQKCDQTAEHADNRKRRENMKHIEICTIGDEICKGTCQNGHNRVAFGRDTSPKKRVETYNMQNTRGASQRLSLSNER